MEITRQTAVASYVIVPLIDASSRPSYRANPTIASGDCKILRHTGGAWNEANIGTLPAVVGTSTKQVLFTLTAAELTSDNLDYPIIIQMIDQTGTKEWDDQEIVIWTKPSAVNSVQQNGTALTARDIGTSVLLSSGTGTGQISLSSGAVTVGTNNDKTGYALSSTQTFNMTGSITGNLSGSAGSVTAAVNINSNSDIMAIKTKTDQLTFTIANKVDATASATGTYDANIVSIDGQATNGNNATLNLKKLNIVNSAGDAVVASSTGSNGNGINASGNGSGDGLKCQAGATGSGVHAIAGSGSITYGIFADQNGGDSVGICAKGNGGTLTSGAGIDCMGVTAGMKLTGSTGHGLQCIGNVGNGIFATGTFGCGIKATGGTDYAGMSLIGGASWPGLDLIGGAGGVGLRAAKGSSGSYDIQAAEIQAIKTQTDKMIFTGTGRIDANMKAIDEQLTNGNNATLNLKKLNIVNSAGDAVVASSTGSNGNGINASGNGSGSGVLLVGGDTGNGAWFNGGATSGYGIKAFGTAGYAGLICKGGALASGIDAIGGDTNGDGIHCQAGATSGHGFASYGQGAGHGAYFSAVANGYHGIYSHASIGDGLRLVGSAYDVNAKEINGIKTKTDQFVFTVANRVDATATVSGTVTLGDGSITSSTFAAGAIDANAFAQAAADKVWSTTSRAITDKSGFSLSSTQTFNLTGNITGNLSGSVGSVTAAVTVGTNNDKTGYALTAAYDSAKTAASASALSITDGKIDGIKIKTDQLIFTGSYLNSQTKGMDTDVISSVAVSSAAVTKIQSGLSTSSDMTTLNGKLDTIYTTEGLIINAVSDVDGKVQDVVDVLPSSGRISSLALTDQIDTVALSDILTGVLSMSNGRFKKDYPSAGEVTFFKSNSTDVAFVVQVSDTERTKV